MKDFLSRFQNIPNILELDHLTVSGDVTFGTNITLKVSVYCVLYICIYLLLPYRELSLSLLIMENGLTFPQGLCWKTKLYLEICVFWTIELLTFFV